jgi:CRISPR-associated protein (TIGR02584 family)
MRDVVLFAGVGPNPAPVSEAIWALYRQRELRVAEAHLVSLSEGHHFLRLEFLDEGAALSQLQECLPGILPHACVHETRVRTPTSGGRVDSDLDPHHAAAYRNSVWDAARECLASAGERPVVFLLAGGRLRTTTAYVTTVFQLLARPCDQLLDVRVDDRRVEGGTGFFFPEQPLRWIHPRSRQARFVELLRQLVPEDSARVWIEQKVQERWASVAGERVEAIDATRVGIDLVDVTVPRLRTLVPEDALSSFDRALEAAGQVAGELAPPEMAFDLREGTVRVAGQPLDIPRSALVWLAALALHKLDSTEGDDWLAVADTDRIRRLLHPIRDLRWVRNHVRSKALAAVMGVEGVKMPPVDKEGERLKKLRADTRRDLEKWLDDPDRRDWSRWLIPEARKEAHEGFQRLPLPRAFITVTLPTRTAVKAPP